ncbi:MAG: hypothetical protein Q7J68_04260 [Thermoplasmata archaeon]|nr:hypothetical protein [Thermoplasmata archaeon]
MKWPSTAFFSRVNERNCIALLAILFVIMSILVVSVPYDPSTDKADATTNDIWVEQFSHGIHYIPYDEWTYGQTQSVVVEYEGQYVVVNEKGPGHVIMMLPFYMAGMDWLFSIVMVGLAILGTYMLGKRLLSWQVGFIASLLVLFNLVVIVMWHRFYWTDASTMHLMVLAFWLLVEGNYRYNGKSLDPGKTDIASPRERFMGMVICILSGLAFGASVSTRYPTGLLIAAFVLYLAGFYFLRTWPSLKEKNYKTVLKKGMPLIFLLGAFTIGLLIVLVPLTQYNSTYFGGPFNSGYDATTLMDFNRTGVLDIRNSTASWTSNVVSYISTALENLILLMPVFLSRLPALIFLPLGAYFLRKKKLELAVLLLWVGINFFTYLSLEWVAMYARPGLVPLEPRYWMPSLPAISILGAFGIYGFANWIAKKKSQENSRPDYKSRTVKILLTGAIVGVLILWSFVPAVSYLQDPNIQGGNQPPPNQQVMLVTTDQLLSVPQEYVDRAVVLENVEVISVRNNMVEVRSQNSSNQDTVPVRFVEWPPGTLPNFTLGQHLTIRGMFVREPAPPGTLPGYLVGVKYGTQDFVRLLP